MARLIVDAVSRIFSGDDNQLELLVSVSRADTGWAVTGLTSPNFQLSHRLGANLKLEIRMVEEARWETSDTTPSGCYYLLTQVTREDGRRMEAWEVNQVLEHSFGLRVRKAIPAAEPPGQAGSGGRPGEWKKAGPTPQAIQYDQGQSIIRFEKFREFDPQH